jgi:hypothetical protein
MNLTWMKKKWWSKETDEEDFGDEDSDIGPPAELVRVPASVAAGREKRSCTKRLQALIL